MSDSGQPHDGPHVRVPAGGHDDDGRDRRDAALRCQQDVPPEDVAAFALDAEPAAGIDLAAHLPHCPACRAVLASLAPSRRAGDLLRRETIAAPAAVSQRALTRVRAEATARLLLSAFVDATVRVAQAAPDYLGRRPGER